MKARPFEVLWNAAKAKTYSFKREKNFIYVFEDKNSSKCLNKWVKIQFAPEMDKNGQMEKEKIPAKKNKKFQIEKKNLMEHFVEHNVWMHTRVCRLAVQMNGNSYRKKGGRKVEKTKIMKTFSHRTEFS